MIFHLFIYIRHFYGYITNLQSDQLPDGLIAQSVEHCTGIAEVMGSNPVRISKASDDVKSFIFFDA